MITKINYQEALKLHTFMVCEFRGISMRPLLRQGKDKIVIEEIEHYLSHTPLKKYDVVMFLRERTEQGSVYILHRILRINPDGTFWIVGDNCASGDLVQPDQIVGVMTEFFRDVKVCQPKGILYTLYVNLWCRPWPLRFFLLKCRYGVSKIIRGFLKERRNN